MKTYLYLFFFLISSSLYASHNVGGSLTWTRVSGTNTVNFKIVSLWEGSYDGITLNTGDGTTTVPMTVVSSENYGGFLRVTYTGSYTYPSAGNFTANANSCCLIDEYLNAASYSYSYSSMVDLSSGSLGSPSLIDPVILEFVPGVLGSRQLNFTDPNGGTVSYSTTPLYGSANVPSGFSISSTGLISWSNSSAVNGNYYFVRIVASSGNNKTGVEIPIRITNTPSLFTCAGQNTINIPANTNGNFSQFTINSGASISNILIGSLPSGMTSIIQNDTAKFNWTPTSSQASNSYSITSTFTNSASQTLTCSTTVNVTDKRIVSCYDFANNSQDYYGLNNGNLTGGTFVNSRNNLSQNALLLNGSSDFMSIPTNDLINNKYSFSAWIRPMSLPTTSGSLSRSLISLGNLSGDQSIFFSYNSTTAGQTLVNNASGYTFSGNNYVTTSLQSGSSAPWKHLVVTNDGVSSKTYIDGILAGNNTISSGTALYNTPLLGFIGKRISNSQFYHGEIDDVMLIKDALNENEIIALSKNSGGCPTNIVSQKFIRIQSTLAAATCVGTSQTLNFIHNEFPSNTSFKLELSDVNGDFSNPLILATTTSSSFTFSFPTTLIADSTYKIRVTSGNTVSLNDLLTKINKIAFVSLIQKNDSIYSGNTSELKFYGNGSLPVTLNIGNYGAFTLTKYSDVINVSPYASQSFTITSASNACGSASFSTQAHNVWIFGANNIVTCIPFENSTNDMVGGRIGAISIPSSDYINGAFGKSLLSKSTHPVIGFNSQGFFSSQFTYSAWFKASSLPLPGEEQEIVSFKSTNFSHTLGIIANGDTYDAPAIKFTSSSTLGTYQNMYYNFNDTTSWHHLAAIRNKDSLLLYLDFTLIAKLKTTQSLPAFANSTIQIAGNQGLKFKGRLDEVKIFKGALSISEIQDLKNFNGCEYVKPWRELELVSCYGFNGNRIDNVSSINASNTYGTFVSDRFGNPSSAIDFNGTGSISLPMSSKLKNRNYTYSFWIKLPTYTSYVQGLFGVGGQAIQVNNQGFLFVTSYTRLNLESLGSAIPIPLNAWTHVICVVEDELERIYFNGNLVGSKIIPLNTTLDYPNSFVIGNRVNSEFMLGSFDDFKIYKGAINTEEAKALYQKENTSSTCNYFVCQPYKIQEGLTPLNNNLYGQLILKQNSWTQSPYDYSASKSVTILPGNSISNTFKAEIKTCVNMVTPGGGLNPKYSTLSTPSTTCNQVNVWNEKNISSQLLNDISFISPTSGFILGANGTLYQTIDGGETFTSKSILNNSYLTYYTKFLSPTKGFVSTENNALYKTEDGGNTWNSSLGIKYTRRIYSLDSLNIFVIGTNNFSSIALYKTSNGGQTWTDLSSNATSSSSVGYSLFFINSQLGFIGGSYSKFRKTTNGGQTWSDVSLPNLPSGTTAQTIQDIRFENSTNGFMTGGEFNSTTSKFLYSTTDAGSTWTKLNLPSVAFNSNALPTRIYKNNNLLYLIVNGQNSNPNTVYSSSDLGQTWVLVYSSTTYVPNIQFLDNCNAIIINHSGSIVIGRND
ncbi:MAG: LamG-like jellyroll fold domain-containing protein [Leadbetterella sp.]